MVLLNDLLYLVQPHVRSCPEPLMKDALVRAARRFASETRMLRETLVLDIVEGQSYYALAPASDQEEVTAIKATAGGSDEIGGASLGSVPLNPVAPEEVPPGNGCPYAFWFEPTKEIVIIRTPNFSKVEGLAVRIIRQPKRTALSITEEMIDQDDGEQTVAAAALAELLLMPGAWTNPQMAAVHENRYLDKQRVARHRADTQYRPTAFRTRPGTSDFLR